MMPFVNRKTKFACLAVLAGLVGALGVAVQAEGLDGKLKESEAKRIKAIEMVKPSVVAIFAPGGQGGGSGVLISEEGYALTNFHVVEGSGPVMQCGLPDGVLYDAVLVGLDKVGDVALIKLIPKKEGNKFPFAKLGDSDKLQAGDWSMAMGNPFLLATDFTPTVTFGLISGIHRYQYPSGTILEYTDCIQVDTSINPGNSGGPLFNMDGELIGINGRGSFEKRGRVNSGVGYAISINQIKNFMGHLKAGLDVDHASLGALVETPNEEEGPAAAHLKVRSILDVTDCDARRRGLDQGDFLLSFAGRPMTTVNEFKNVLGLYPRGWRMPLTFRHEDENKNNSEVRQILVRLMGVQHQELDDANQPKPGEPPPPKPGPKPAPVNPAVAKLYEAKPGFANFYFNKLERDRLLAAFAKQGDFTALNGTWTIEASGEVRDKGNVVRVEIADKKDKEGKNAFTNVKCYIGEVDFDLDPLKTNQEKDDLKQPPGSGGFMMALYHYRQLLTSGAKGFVGEITHGGFEPFYMPAASGEKPDYIKQRVLAEVIQTRHGGVPVKWFFSMQDQSLLGFEVSVEREDDPCEVYLSDYQKVEGRSLPHRMEVRYGDKRYANLKINSYKLAAAK
ncbi:MAG TPA: trypsin-like peptidase domain-containing protein [Gemmataceae bacterium]|nr:trypsin-like peptidase domain-containing protein [Gemmataceae bacterium]